MFPLSEPAGLLTLADKLHSVGALSGAAVNPVTSSAGERWVPAEFAVFARRYQRTPLHAVFVPKLSRARVPNIALAADWLNELTGDELDLYVDARDLGSRIEFDMGSDSRLGPLAATYAACAGDSLLVWERSISSGAIIPLFDGLRQRSTSSIVTTVSAFLQHWHIHHDLGGAAAAASATSLQRVKRTGIVRKTAKLVPMIISENKLMQDSLRKVQDETGIDYMPVLAELDRLATASPGSFAYLLPRIAVAVTVAASATLGVLANIEGGTEAIVDGVEAIVDLYNWLQIQLPMMVELGESLVM